MRTSSRRGLMTAATAIAAFAAVPAGAVEEARSAPVLQANPDAELIATCRQHIINMDAFNADGGHLEPEKCPLHRAYIGTLYAINDMKPQTIAGLAAKARAAKAEALEPNGEEDPDATVAEDWAWDLVNDLLRLAGEA